MHPQKSTRVSAILVLLFIIFIYTFTYTITSKINVTSKGVHLPVSKLHSILAVANLLAHNNTSQICYCGQISLQSAAGFLTVWHLWWVTLILLQWYTLWWETRYRRLLSALHSVCWNQKSALREIWDLLDFRHSTFRRQQMMGKIPSTFLSNSLLFSLQFPTLFSPIPSTFSLQFPPLFSPIPSTFLSNSLHFSLQFPPLFSPIPSTFPSNFPHYSLQFLPLFSPIPCTFFSNSLHFSLQFPPLFSPIPSTFLSNSCQGNKWGYNLASGVLKECCLWGIFI